MESVYYSCHGKQGWVAVLLFFKSVVKSYDKPVLPLSIQELAEMDWSEVRLVDLTLDWYWSPQASHKSNDHRDAALRYTLDIASLMLAPRLRSFSLFCGNLKLHNYSMITRQMLDAKHLKLILRSMRKFDDEDAAWLQSLGHKMTRIEPEGPVQLPFYWESRC